MSETYTIQIKAENATLRLDWDNREAPKDNFTCGCLLLFWVVWVPVTCVATYLAIVKLNAGGRESIGTGVFLTVWSVFAWLAIPLIPWTLLRRSWLEWIEITSVTITHGHEGFWAPRPRSYSIGPGMELFLGHLGDESVATLNLLWTSRFGFTNRAMLGYWLAPKIKEQVFLAIATFVELHKIPLGIKPSPHFPTPITPSPSSLPTPPV